MYIINNVVYSFGDFDSGTMVEDFRNANTMFGDISSGNTQ